MEPSFATAVADIDLHSLGERMATEMDEQAIRSEVMRQFHAHRHQEHRPRRPLVHRRAAANAAPVKFSLRLSNEEAMEDVAAVSVPKDVKPETRAPARHRNRKRRRGGRWHQLQIADEVREPSAAGGSDETCLPTSESSIVWSDYVTSNASSHIHKL
ncbi:hypothetical protein ZWY2020_057035 [Hordeum vulgare]|nr:hypothetical protein ZWY2020_057035 [Hordeum vulgare]